RLDPSGRAELGSDRIERSVRVIGRALMTDAGAGIRDPVPQGLRDPGFADAGLTGQDDDLSLAVARQAPAIKQQSDLLLAADKRPQRRGTGGGETAFGRPFVEHLRQRHRPRDAFQRTRAEVVIAEPVAGQAPGRGCDDDPTGRRLRLQPRRQIGCLAYHGVGFAATDFAYDDQPGSDANAGAERHASAPKGGRSPGYLQGGAYGPFGIVLMSFGIAEINQH